MPRYRPALRFKPSLREQMQVYRVQAADGRGPWRPGFSHLWIEDDSEERAARMPDIVSAFGTEWLAEIPLGWACGCACRSLDILFAWFTPAERISLESMGYTPVSLAVDAVIRERHEQLIFARRLPLNQAAIQLPWRHEITV